MSYIVLVDMRENNGHVVAISDDTEEGNIAQFKSMPQVDSMMKDQPLCKTFSSIVIDLDNLEIM